MHPGPGGTPIGSGDMVAEIECTNATIPKLAVMGTSFIDPGNAEPEQIADAVAFLVSDDARWITAGHLAVDGGAQHF